ncbi:MAG: hypothetical protein U1E39_09600 [Planctomycetota bacterium]
MRRTPLLLVAAALAAAALSAPARADAPDGGRPAVPGPVADAAVAPRAPWDPVAIRVGGADDVRYRAPAGEACCERVGVELTMPLWVPSLSGSLASGGTEVDADRKARGLEGVVDKLVPDVVTSIEFFFMGRGTVSKGPWSFSADAFYVSLSETVDWRILGEDTTGSMRGVVGRAYGAWQATTSLGCGPCAPTLEVGPTLGARVFALDLHVDRIVGDDIDRSTSWVDAIGGVKLDVTFSNRASFHVLADYGGSFDGQHTSWSLSAELAWPLGRGGHWYVLGGWTVLNIDYDVGSGPDRYHVGLNLSGPHIGFTYVF